MDQGTWSSSQGTRQDKKTRRWMIWILLLVSDFLPKHLGWINIFAWRILSYLCKQISNPSLQILSERGSWWLWIPPSWPCYNKLSLFCKDKTAVAAARQFLLLSQSDSSPLLSDKHQDVLWHQTSDSPALAWLVVRVRQFWADEEDDINYSLAGCVSDM